MKTFQKIFSVFFFRWEKSEKLIVIIIALSRLLEITFWSTRKIDLRKFLFLNRAFIQTYWIEHNFDSDHHILITTLSFVCNLTLTKDNMLSIRMSFVSDSLTRVILFNFRTLVSHFLLIQIYSYTSRTENNKKCDFQNAFNSKFYYRHFSRRKKPRIMCPYK